MSFVILNRAHIRSLEEARIVTPNERLAREALHAYNEYQRLRSVTAWPRPNIGSLDHYLRELHTQASAANPGEPQLLSTDQELTLWLETADDDHTALAGLAVDAWRTLHDYEIDPAHEGLARTANGRLCQRWMSRFRDALAARGAITQAQLSAWAEHALHNTNLNVGSWVSLWSFDRLTPALSSLIARLDTLGCDVTRLDSSRRTPRASYRLGFPGTHDEISSAALWSRRLLERSPEACVGVVFPYLTQRRTAIESAFCNVFRDAPHAYDVSGGAPLHSQPVWRCAEALLQFCWDHIDHADLVHLTSSPYLALVPELPEGVPPTQYALADEGPASPLRNRLNPLVQHAEATLPEWFRRFRILLRAAGWNGRGAGSIQYQAHQRLLTCLASPAPAARASRVLGFTAALTRLRTLMASTPFAPHRAHAPVLALGYLETTGLHFTHLWVAGLTDTAWPRAPSPNPLLPLLLQREHGVPRVDHDTEAEFAARHFQHWRESASTLVFSHARDDGEDQHRASAFIGDIETTQATRIIRDYLPKGRAWHGLQPVQLDSITDTHGTPRDPAEVRGGTTLLRNQGLCPFRAWAVHTLGLESPEAPMDYPDARMRGTLVHTALDALYSPWVPERPPTSDVPRAVDEALSIHAADLPEEFLTAERMRITEVLQMWLEYEHSREPFQLEEPETRSLLTLGEVTLRMRIDRIDRIEDGRFVIDYKTGSTQLPGRDEKRLIEPQLPMYALATEGSVGAAFAQVSHQKPRLRGIAFSDQIISRDIQRLDQAEWTQALDRWRGQLLALMQEHLDAYAVVEPVNDDACRYCHLRAFCRMRHS
ncbi:MAG: PD-(D/E)XK nuclease family protein [Pseudomonadales bacterium]|nr:PD-(D/E)XK nuclease family protein [Pseudomonadales bacterium]MDP6826134.1 PD-(D/E)XK nuclease family protein [Pseudomonadales bacterium]